MLIRAVLIGGWTAKSVCGLWCRVECVLFLPPAHSPPVPDMQRSSLGYLLFGFILLTPSALKADDASSDVALAARFRESVLPLFETHCLPCHDAETREAELDVSIYKSADDVARGFRTWEIILERVEDMKCYLRSADRQQSC